mmetsp:Transcript_10066/g.26062  ORF Transcript_10066/g.26062 Transcript_10066/m.26062 type:complete len:345 (+) Transcript_10066:731-1765(+)
MLLGIRNLLSRRMEKVDVARVVALGARLRLFSSLLVLVQLATMFRDLLLEVGSILHTPTLAQMSDGRLRLFRLTFAILGCSSLVRRFRQPLLHLSALLLRRERVGVVQLALAEDALKSALGIALRLAAPTLELSEQRAHSLVFRCCSRGLGEVVDGSVDLSLRGCHRLGECARPPVERLRVAAVDLDRIRACLHTALVVLLESRAELWRPGRGSAEEAGSQVVVARGGELLHGTKLCLVLRLALAVDLINEIDGLILDALLLPVRVELVEVAERAKRRFVALDCTRVGLLAEELIALLLDFRGTLESVAHRQLAQLEALLVLRPHRILQVCRVSLKLPAILLHL